MPRPLMILAAVVVLLATPRARADQFQYLDLTQAEAALRRVHVGDVVHHFCAPCGDTRSERMTVRALGIDRVWDGRGSSKVYRDGDRRGYWQLELNDVTVDLAYVYVRDGRGWRNLADLLGLRPQLVPARLPATAIGTRWRCGDRSDGSRTAAFDGPRDPCAADAPSRRAVRGGAGR